MKHLTELKRDYIAAGDKLESETDCHSVHAGAVFTIRPCVLLNMLPRVYVRDDRDPDCAPMCSPGATQCLHQPLTLER
jgi:hypothetical protein